MRITRLHLLFAGIGAMLMIFGTVNWFGQTFQSLWNKAQMPALPRIRTSTPPGEDADLASAMEQQRKQAAESIAVVGEAYRRLQKQFGDVSPVSKPLRSAKQLYAQKEYNQAEHAARESWLALKMFRGKVDEATQPYQVVRGDTLWRIAQQYSPPRAGAAWVTIWKANQQLVADFDRLEVGWTLAIPMKPSQYVMPFWKPK